MYHEQPPAIWLGVEEESIIFLRQQRRYTDRAGNDDLVGARSPRQQLRNSVVKFFDYRCHALFLGKTRALGACNESIFCLEVKLVNGGPISGH